MTEFLSPLPVETLRAEGVPEPWRYGHRDRVRFYEIDALQHVNNTAYLRWFETLRVQYLEALGLPFYREGSHQLILKSVTCDYHAPVVLHEDYIVTGRTESVRTTSFRMEYAVWSGGLRATGTAVIVQMDPTASAKQPLSPEMRAVLIAADGAVDAR